MTTSKCVKNGSDPGYADGLSRDFTVANGDEVVCTFRNVRKTVQITTVKDFVGTPASISIAAGPQSKQIAGDDQVSASVEVGTSQAFSETLTDAQKALYDTTVRCTGDQAAQAGVYSRQLAVGTDALTCTFVNTRKQGTLEIRKDFTGSGTHKQVELRLDGSTKATLSADGTTGSADARHGLVHRVGGVQHASVTATSTRRRTRAPGTGSRTSQAPTGARRRSTSARATSSSARSSTRARR